MLSDRKQLRRLQSLREAREQMQELVWARQKQALTRVEETLRECEQRLQNCLASAASKTLLRDRAEWRVARVTVERSRAVQAALQIQVEQRTQACDQERHRLTAAKCATEQARLLRHSAEQRSRRNRERRAQAQLDDLFAARKHWNGVQERDSE